MWIQTSTLLSIIAIDLKIRYLKIKIVKINWSLPQIRVAINQHPLLISQALFKARMNKKWIAGQQFRVNSDIQRSLFNLKEKFNLKNKDHKPIMIIYFRLILSKPRMRIQNQFYQREQSKTQIKNCVVTEVMRKVKIKVKWLQFHRL